MGTPVDPEVNNVNTGVSLVSVQGFEISSNSFCKSIFETSNICLNSVKSKFNDILESVITVVTSVNFNMERTRSIGWLRLIGITEQPERHIANMEATIKGFRSMQTAILVFWVPKESR